MSNECGKLEIDLLLNKMTNLFDAINGSIQDHKKSLNEMMTENGYNNKEIKNLLLSEIHVIDCIGKNRPCNTTFISKQLNMTKGAISKITVKLLEKGLIEVNRLENNKKERYYTLTVSGKEIFNIHGKLHEIENKKLADLLCQYNKKELNTINNFIDDLLNEWL
ncbi:MarR family transcriptional regulator [Clostridium sp. Marseille-P2415]|uniref:MarR family transcriptional regulator n=1 Tax=Clostridium sp. Marseille-P2415 TaxID=1805471 RepID=UPI001F43BC45|nr:MarR family transcriptional regulator [Clostridium sp. Marseille-P2415]